MEDEVITRVTIEVGLTGDGEDQTTRAREGHGTGLVGGAGFDDEGSCYSALEVETNDLDGIAIDSCDNYFVT